MSDSDKRLRNLRRRVNKARRFCENTCPASRHLHMMAENLIRDGRYHMIETEPVHCAETMLSVLESLWKLRTATGWPDEKTRRRTERALEKAFGTMPHRPSGRGVR